MFYDIYVQLCNKKGISPSRLAEELGISKSSVTKWKQSSEMIPRSDALQKIAKYFDVSTDYLLGIKKEPSDLKDTEDSPAFFRLKKGLESFELDDSDVDFLLTVYKAHKKKNEE